MQTLPTLLAPNKIVKEGSPSNARSTAVISDFLGKKPGKRENVCLGRSCERSRFSLISRRASSKRRRDSVSDRTVSAGLGPCQHYDISTWRDRLTLVMTPKTSLIPKKFRLWISGGRYEVRRRGILLLNSHCTEGMRLGGVVSETLRSLLLLVAVWFIWLPGIFNECRRL